MRHVIIGASAARLAGAETLRKWAPGVQGTRHIWDVSTGDLLVDGPLAQYAPLDDARWNSKPLGAQLTSNAAWPPLGPASNAKWISNTEFVNPINTSSWRRFTQTVCFQPDDPAANVSGTIQVSADNAKEVYVDGVLVGSDGDMTSSDSQFNATGDHQEWSRFTVYNFSTAPEPIPGTEFYSLTFDFIVRNGPGVWKVGEVPTAQKNPTGLIFDATVDNVTSFLCPEIDTQITLHLRKDVINNNGGTATTTDFTLAAEGTLPNNGISGTSPVDGFVGPDTFILSETGPAGYTAGSWSCDNGTLNGNSLTLSP